VLAQGEEEVEGGLVGHRIGPDELRHVPACPPTLLELALRY
jgi:hypothetical protein